MNNVFDLIVGASDYITVDFINDLDRTNNAEVLTAVMWTIENEAVATLVGGSPAVDAGGRYASAKFTAVAEGVTRVTLTATTSNPSAAPMEYLFIRAYIPPSSV